MEEIIEALRERSQTVPHPLSLPTEDDLIDAEEQLLVPLGADFRAFLLSVSDVICGSLEPVTIADPQSHTYLPEVAASAWDSGLPRELLPLCELADGYYCVDLSDEVVLWRPDSGVEQSWQDIWDWANDVWLNS